MQSTDKKNQEKTYKVTLTEEQISILKAGLQYYLLDEEFSYSIWTTFPEMNYSSSDRNYMFKANDIYKKLDEASRIKPNYGRWGSIEALSKLCKAECKRKKIK